MLSLENQPFRLVALITVLFGLLALSACSFAPVYGGNNAQRHDLAFASPVSRLEQIVYQDLVARFGRSTNPEALQVKVSVTSSTLRPGQSSIAVNGDITITRPDLSGLTTGVIVYQGTRSANASYQSVPQALARQQASADAAERAAHQLAETVRLALLGALAEGGEVSQNLAATPAVAAGTQ